MLIIIPLGGIGKRFKDEGYNKPKALIEIDKKPMIFYLLDGIVKEIDEKSKILIPYNNEYEKYNFEDVVRKKYPNVNFEFLCLSKQTDGAAETILLSLKNCNLNDCPVLCLDSDSFYTINIIEKWNKNNMVFTIIDKSIEPIFSYIKKDDDENIIDIIEKEKISDYACTGAYGFSSYKNLIIEIEELIEKNIKINNEFYTSLIIKKMIEKNINFKNITILRNEWKCLGTPLHVKIFSKNFPLTCVSGYWKVDNKHGNSFDKWFENTLKLNCPYVFFSNKETIELIKKHRCDLPTYYIEMKIEDFYTYKYKYMMKVDKRHCPSVELNLIWNEKIFLIQKALKLNPFNSDYFMWNDAGVCTLRNKCPPEIYFPNTDKLYELPKDKFIYSMSLPYREDFILKTRYYLHHHIAGSNYILHKDIVGKFVDLYKEYLNLIDKDDIYTDQVLWTLIYKNNKELFYKLCDGYGEIINKIY